VSSILVDLPFNTTAPGLARGRLQDFVSENRLDATLERLLLISSELVSNALLHGRPPLSMGCDCDCHRVLIEVSDGDAETASVARRTPDDSIPGGHGLNIVDALADSWGTELRTPGKSVWASVSDGSDG